MGLDSPQTRCFAGSICFFVVLVGFGVSEILIYTSGTSFPSNATCGQFTDNLTSFTAKKEIFKQWHWTYSFEEFDGKIEQVCPSQKHDVNVFVGGNLVARSDGKIASFVSRIDINDCSDKRIAQMRTGNLFETIVNSNRIKVSMEVRNTSDEVVAYVDGTHFFGNNIDIRGEDGTIIANMKRDTLSFSWKWVFTVFQPDELGAQPAILSVIAGQKAFDDGEKTDYCNNYFFAVAYIFLAIGIIIVGVMAFLVYQKFWKNRKEDEKESLPDKSPSEDYIKTTPSVSMKSPKDYKAVSTSPEDSDPGAHFISPGFVSVTGQARPYEPYNPHSQPQPYSPQPQQYAPPPQPYGQSQVGQPVSYGQPYNPPAQPQPYAPYSPHDPPGYVQNSPS